MSPDLEGLARRAVACKGWRWMAGMLVNSAGTVYRMTEETLVLGTGSREYAIEWMRPDLADPCTLGGLLALVREAWGNQIVVSVGDGWWEVESDDGFWNHDNTPSFVAALVAALEAAP